MNLYLRLLWLILRFPFMAKQNDILAPATLTMRVLPNDLDLNLHVNNGRYLTLMDLGRLHLMAITGLLLRSIRKKWQPMLGSAKVHFIRPLNLFDKFTMTTQVVYWDEKWVYMEQKIFKNNTLCVIAHFKTLFSGKNGKVPSEELLAVLPHPPSTPTIPDAIKYWLEAEKNTPK